MTWKNARDLPPPVPHQVVCPSSLVVNWKRELARFAPGADTVTYLGHDRSLDGITPATIVIITHGVLRRDHATLAARTWDLVVADEAQHVKNPASQTARQLRTVPSAMRLALTGTPVENNLSELWALLDWCCPGLFGTLASFRSHYATAAERDPTGPSAQQLALIAAPLVLRRRKTDPGIRSAPAVVGQGQGCRPPARLPGPGRRPCCRRRLSRIWRAVHGSTEERITVSKKAEAPLAERIRDHGARPACPSAY
ncbi:SNF2-related protein [Streptomyces sp. NPDC093108]|uniref:SNF2-related protein n=1 Tax=Streptomyces sp. NPDC093108 TaxID=3366030 RepID=UPI0037F72344